MKVAESYWKPRLVKCGDSTLWTVRRSGVGKPPNGDVTTFLGKGPPVMTVDGQYLSPKPNTEVKSLKGIETQPADWSGRARISFERGGTLWCTSCTLENGWKNDFGYTIEIRKVNGTWEAQETDSPNENILTDPLFEDIASSRVAILSKCLEGGGNPNERNEAGETLLMTAAKFGRGDAMLMLLEHGADANLKYRDGSTAAYLARIQNHQELVNVFDLIGAICDGPDKTTCAKRKQDVSGSAILVADPLLMEPRVSERPSNEKSRTTRVRILSKPEPQYTEEARSRGVVGTVILSMLFLPSGEVTNIRVLSGLPYGLSERAIEAAKRLKFTPAMIDGRAVEQEMRMEYIFQLY